MEIRNSLSQKDLRDTHPYLIFMYGTLKSTEPNHNQLFVKDPDGTIFVGRARTINKFPLVVTTPFNIPFLLHKEGTGNQIEGELYHINDATLKHLDWFEGHPHWYERRLIKVEHLSDSEGRNFQPQTLECWLYGLPRFKCSLLDLPLLAVYHNEDTENYKQFRTYNPDKDEPLFHYLFDE